jgi:hypothetical protein
MTLSAFLRYLGLVLQLAGFGTVAWGLVDLRRRFTDRPSLLTVAWQRIGRAASGAAAFGRRMIGRPRSQVVYPLDIASEVNVSGNLMLEQTYGEISDDLPAKEQLRLLDQRIRDLRRDFNRLQRQAAEHRPSAAWPATSGTHAPRRRRRSRHTRQRHPRRPAQGPGLIPTASAQTRAPGGHAVSEVRLGSSSARSWSSPESVWAVT